MKAFLLALLFFKRFACAGCGLLFAGHLILTLIAVVNGARHKTLVVSFDGFAQHYFKTRLFFLPWFDNFRRKEGVHSLSIRSVFPAETFPNHFSIVTGLYPESHGVIANSMYDPATGRHFYMNSTDPAWWSQSGAEPIWISTLKANMSLKTAVFAWPGGNVFFSNLSADFVRSYDSSVPFRSRVDEMVELMSTSGVDLGFLYHHQPDQTGHSKGISGPHMANELIRADWLLSYVILATERAGLTRDNLNLIVCSDHGMVNVRRHVILESYINLASNIESFSQSGSYVLLWPKPRMEQRVYDTLKREADKSQGEWLVFNRTTIPHHFHFSNNVRISPVLVMGSLGTWIDVAGKRDATREHLGAHGYDPEHEEMQPIFMARGPAFKRGVNDSASDSVRDPNSVIVPLGNKTSSGVPARRYLETKDIYALLAYLVGLPPKHQPPNNASLELFRPLLASNAVAKNWKRGYLWSFSSGTGDFCYGLGVVGIGLLANAIHRASLLQLRQ